MNAHIIKTETIGLYDPLPDDASELLSALNPGKALEQIYDYDDRECGEPYSPFFIGYAIKRLREEFPDVNPDLSGAKFYNCNLSNVDLSYANLTNARIVDSIISCANFSKAILKGVDLGGSDLSFADFNGADLSNATFGPGVYATLDTDEVDPFCTITTYEYDNYANLSNSNFTGANLCNADFESVNLSGAILDGADLTGANLKKANLTNASLRGANLTNCKVNGVNVWNVDTEGAIQTNLIISSHEEPIIAVDNIQIAQFMHMLINNSSVRDFIDTITSKTVLILGRFTPERKIVLDTIRDSLRREGYIPILFDFSVPNNRDITETISTLAHLSKFIIADITDAKSVPQELMRIVPSLPSVPVQPILMQNKSEYAMFEHFKKYPWVLEIYEYNEFGEFKTNIKELLISPAEKMLKR